MLINRETAIERIKETAIERIFEIIELYPETSEENKKVRDALLCAVELIKDIKEEECEN